jgi:hypothetical protein
VPGQYAFTHANRLHKRAEYDQIFQRGAKVVGRHFVCYWVRRGESGSKLGVAVARRSCADLTFQESADALDLMLRQGGVVA